jgi:hypothetical protein
VSGQREKGDPIVLLAALRSDETANSPAPIPTQGHQQ